MFHVHQDQVLHARTCLYLHQCNASLAMAFGAFVGEILVAISDEYDWSI